VRKVYSLTERGRAELLAWLRTEPALPQLRHPLLVQLAWADALTPPELDALLAAYEVEINAQLEMAEEQGQGGDHDPAGNLRDGFVRPAEARTPRERYLWRMIWQNWIGFYQAELTWVRRLRRGLKERLR
jgi:hypothetical protein